ncbi:hypothetical protein NIES4072_03790 [Nostoc commune NIES-4072]|uniref:Uncharacterized protein n=1 Tax=Nostoc commune NIES-4072 TaxID=2005467 RepID=A0A2R5FKG3_NOSCO|nr:hypothetical protein NIES4070_23030 [Nostoc commune HK-02]GBG16733.1 hypothetical protein NIES4072_03790 [Nostoc commune NIES-4072]
MLYYAQSITKAFSFWSHRGAMSPTGYSASQQALFSAASTSNVMIINRLIINKLAQINLNSTEMINRLCRAVKNH